jgi:hypothetical protein
MDNHSGPHMSVVARTQPPPKLTPSSNRELTAASPSCPRLLAAAVSLAHTSCVPPGATLPFKATASFLVLAYLSARPCPPLAAGSSPLLLDEALDG